MSSKFLFVFGILSVAMTTLAATMSLSECKEKAADGDAEALWQLGQRYENGDGIRKAGVSTSEGGVNTTEKTGLKTPRKHPENTQSNTQKILEAMRVNPFITRRELAAITGMKPDGVKSAINRLKESGDVRRVGPDKGGHWEIVKPQPQTGGNGS